MSDKKGKPDEEALIVDAPAPELKEQGTDPDNKLAQAEQKAKEYWDQLLRMRAEMDNLQKRSQRDVEHAHKYALEPFIKALIPVVDSLEQGLSMPTDSGEHAKALHHGMELTLKMFLSTLARFHVEIVDPLHEAFDPTHHEAMVMQPSEEHAPGTILTVVQKGYILHGRLLRPARVIVSRDK
jgi:molecular chaperone GrpE